MAQMKNKKSQKKALLGEIIEKLKITLTDFSKKSGSKKYDRTLRKAGKIIVRNFKLDDSRDKNKSATKKKGKKKPNKIQVAS